MGCLPGMPGSVDGMLTETLVKCTIVSPVSCAQVSRRTPPVRPVRSFRTAERVSACPLRPAGHRFRPALSAGDPQEIGGYRLHGRLGSGGMGVVYLAHTRGGRPIALKAVREDFAADPGFRLRFADEVAGARRIHGLFTAQVVDSGVDDPVPWLATAYVPGPSLAQAVQRHGPLPPRTVLRLVAGIAEALQAIHGAGVVHRDLKPANVLIAGDGPRVIDFGIARAADATGLTGTGLRIGTAAYMAPEQALGLPVTPAADVFALGALAAYVAGGVPPFGPGPESATLYRVVHEQPDLSRVPYDLRALLGRCLAEQPELRPAPDDIIAAVHAHPGVAPSLEFTQGRLPAGLRGEIGRSGESDVYGPGGARPLPRPASTRRSTRCTWRPPGPGPRPPGSRPPPARTRRAPAAFRAVRKRAPGAPNTADAVGVPVPLPTGGVAGGDYGGGVSSRLRWPVHSSWLRPPPCCISRTVRTRPVRTARTIPGDRPRRPPFRICGLPPPRRCRRPPPRTHRPTRKPS
ncbi:serine/threonine-protein kinase [Streptomyces microflavus]|uniref:serine/threonine-protein kinase n=1 Tax=Streptomyces microflavus TaxID=1919 RepID=UPI0036A31615